MHQLCQGTLRFVSNSIGNRRSSCRHLAPLRTDRDASLDRPGASFVHVTRRTKPCLRATSSTSTCVMPLPLLLRSMELRTTHSWRHRRVRTRCKLPIERKSNRVQPIGDPGGRTKIPSDQREARRSGVSDQGRSNGTVSKRMDVPRVHHFTSWDTCERRCSAFSRG